MNLTLAEHMHMYVMDRLTAKVVAVHDNPKAFLAALLLSETLRGKKNMPSKDLVVVFAQTMQGRDMFFRDYQEMYRRLGRDVIEGDNLFVFIDLLRRDSPGHDLAK